MGPTCAKFSPITWPIITKIGPTDPSTRIVRSHVLSNRQPEATLLNCRCWADYITVTLARPVGSENLIRPQIVDLQRLAAELSPPCFSCLGPVRRRVSNNSPGTGIY